MYTLGCGTIPAPYLVVVVGQCRRFVLQCEDDRCSIVGVEQLVIRLLLLCVVDGLKEANRFFRSKERTGITAPTGEGFSLLPIGQFADAQALVPGEGAQILQQEAFEAQFSHWLYLSATLSSE